MNREPKIPIKLTNKGIKSVLRGEKKEKGPKRKKIIFEEIIARNLQNLIKDQDLYIQETQRTLSMISKLKRKPH